MSHAYEFFLSVGISIGLAACSSSESPLSVARRERIVFAEHFKKSAGIEKDEVDKCLMLSEIAESMMNSRQAGVSIDRTMETWRSDRFLMPLIYRAYNEPRAEAKVARLSNTTSFALSTLEECLNDFVKRKGKSGGQPSTLDGRMRAVAATQVPAVQRYTAKADGTVFDTHTGRTWLRCSLGQTLDGDRCRGNAAQLRYEDVKEALNELNRRPEVQATGQRWVLPTSEELHGLVYCSTGIQEPFRAFVLSGVCGGNYQRPAIDAAAFPDTPTDPAYWTRTESPDGGRSYVRFYNGLSMVTDLDRAFHVRPILIE